MSRWRAVPKRGMTLLMEELPYIDEHSQRVDAPAHVVWTALLKVLRRQMGGSARLAQILGCDPAQGTAEFTGRPGEAVPGFRVFEAEPGRRLALPRHRLHTLGIGRGPYLPTRHHL